MAKADLERMVNEFSYWQNHSKRLNQDLWDPDQRKEISEKLDQFVDNGRGEIIIPAYVGKSPEFVKEAIDGQIGHFQGNIITYSTDHLNEVLNETKVEGLVSPALILNKEYSKMIEVLKENNLAKMKDYIKNTLYADNKELFESMEYLSSIQSNIFSSKYIREIGKKEAIFKATVLSDEIPGEGGKINYELNKDKTVDYINENLPEADNRTKDNFYLNLGFAYAAQEN